MKNEYDINGGFIDVYDRSMEQSMVNDEGGRLIVRYSYDRKIKHENNTYIFTMITESAAFGLNTSVNIS